MIPVRCFTCGKVVSSLYEDYKHRVREQHESPKKVLDELRVSRYCCRRMLLSHMEMVETLNLYR
ncbi:MAG: DNA-directed RNA polymerase subunit N [Euryarchaeota archaeon]|nr:DNA-directed RNA polymerase subunit N [Euryarchaeota archaeon]